MEGDDSDGVTTYQIPGPCMRPSSWQRVGSYRTALVIDLPGGSTAGVCCVLSSVQDCAISSVSFLRRVSVFGGPLQAEDNTE